MKCNKIEDLLSPYLDGELERDDIIRVEKHLSECEKCSLTLKSFVLIKQKVRRIEIPEVDRTVREKVLSGAGRRKYFQPVKLWREVLAFSRSRRHILRFIFSTSLLVVLGALLIPLLRTDNKVTQKNPKQYYIMKEEKGPYTEVVYEKEGNYVLTNYRGGSF